MADGERQALRDCDGLWVGAIPGRFKGVPRIEKPFDPPALLELVGHLSGVRTNDQAV
jgi:hypothetical protein